MRLIKRFIFVLVLLVLVFFVYRLINPSWAQALLSDLKTTSNDLFWTHFVIEEMINVTWSLAPWSVDSITGDITGETWSLQEMTWDELLLDDLSLIETVTTTWTTEVVTPEPCPSMPTVASCPSGQEKYISFSSTTCWTYYACKAKVTTTLPKTSNGLTSQEKRDMENMLDSFQ